MKIKNAATCALLSLAISACATQPAPEFGGRWRAANRLAETPQPIPLYQAYEFYVSPLDGTLKNALTRWAGDAKMPLSYQAPTDYTLFAPVAEIRSRDLNEATARLSSLYAAQGVAITIESNQIVVRSTPSDATLSAPAQ